MDPAVVGVLDAAGRRVARSMLRREQAMQASRLTLHTFSSSRRAGPASASAPTLPSIGGNGRGSSGGRARGRSMAPAERQAAEEVAAATYSSSRAGMAADGRGRRGSDLDGAQQELLGGTLDGSGPSIELAAGMRARAVRAAVRGDRGALRSLPGGAALERELDAGGLLPAGDESGSSGIGGSRAARGGAGKRHWVSASMPTGLTFDQQMARGAGKAASTARAAAGPPPLPRGKPKGTLPAGPRLATSRRLGDRAYAAQYEARMGRGEDADGALFDYPADVARRIPVSSRLMPYANLRKKHLVKGLRSGCSGTGAAQFEEAGSPEGRGSPTAGVGPAVARRGPLPLDDRDRARVQRWAEATALRSGQQGAEEDVHGQGQPAGSGRGESKEAQGARTRRGSAAGKQRAAPVVLRQPDPLTPERRQRQAAARLLASPMRPMDPRDARGELRLSKSAVVVGPRSTGRGPLAPRIGAGASSTRGEPRRGRGRRAADARGGPPLRRLVPTLSIDSLSQGSDFMVGPSLGGTYSRLRS